MNIPTVRGVIDRRILVNYNVDPDVLAATLPDLFRPKLFRGRGIAGICLIRLTHLRPAIVPAGLGISSENVAHRTAVEWDEGGQVRQGVYVRRRDSSSRLNALLGGRLVPGIHHHARFDVQESDTDFAITVHSDDGLTDIAVRARVAAAIPASSVFTSLEEASAFFEAGSLGYSDTAQPRRFQGLELRCRNWRVEPLEVEQADSNFFADRRLFPPGSIQLDCALLMRGIEHEWHSRQDLCGCSPTPVVAGGLKQESPKCHPSFLSNGEAVP